MKIYYKDILKDDNPLVREKAAPVKLPLTKKDRETLEAMLDYIRCSRDEKLAEEFDYRPAVGLAAPQLGIKKRMFAMVVDEGDENEEKLVEYAFVNPKIISHSMQLAYLGSGEGCLSVEKEHQGYVPRYARITVRGYDMLQDKEVEVRLTGYLAIVAQHEMDHFDGILFYDRINPNNPFMDIPNAIRID